MTAGLPSCGRQQLNGPFIIEVCIKLEHSKLILSAAVPTAHSFPICITMEADLPSLDQLRNNAAECIRLAEAARTSQHKSFFIEMAERWLTLAEHAEKTQAR